MANDRNEERLVGNIAYRTYIAARKKCSRCSRRYCPLLVKLLRSKRTEYRAVKVMLGFPIGVIYGKALEVLVLSRLRLTPFSSDALGAILALCLGIGFAFSSQVRCICLLVIPTFCGRTGRAYVAAHTATYVLTGPIENIMLNGNESLRVLSCVASLSLNQSVERLKLMFTPIKGVIKEFAGGGQQIQKYSKNIDKSYTPIKGEVKGQDELNEAIADTEKLDKDVGGESRVQMVKKKFKNYKKGQFGAESESNYGMKSEFRCEEVFTKGVKGCRNSFGKAYDSCLSSLPLIGYLLCWPMKLTFICDLASSMMGKRSCDSVQALSPGFGESMDTAAGVQKEFDKDFEVKMQYKLVVPEDQVDRITPEDVGEALRNKFNARKKNFEFFMTLINRLMVFMFLQVFLQAQKYCNNYLRVINFDNIYITSYFKHIDARRKRDDKPTLLPLKKSEKLELSDPFGVKLTAEEKGVLIMNMLRIVGEMVTASLIILFDRIFYEFLMLIQRHSHIQFRQTGVHHVNLTIHGNGIIGKLVRKILRGFDQKHTMDTVSSTAKCLPLPIEMPGRDIATIYLLFLLTFCLLFVESYGLRLRRVVCAFFYSKREKKRVLFLYNDRLKKRKSFLHYMRHRVRKMARDQALAIDTGVMQSLRYMYPRYFGWLRKFGMGKRKCLVCEEVEKKKDIFVSCSEECPFAYCWDCWQDMRERCFVCLPDDDDDSELSEDEFSD